VKVEPGYFKSRSWTRFSTSDFCALAFGVIERATNVFASTNVSQPSSRFGGELKGALRSNRPIRPSWISFCRLVSKSLLVPVAVPTSIQSPKAWLHVKGLLPEGDYHLLHCVTLNEIVRNSSRVATFDTRCRRNIRPPLCLLLDWLRCAVRWSGAYFSLFIFKIRMTSIYVY